MSILDIIWLTGGIVMSLISIWSFARNDNIYSKEFPLTILACFVLSWSLILLAIWYFMEEE